MGVSIHIPLSLGSREPLIHNTIPRHTTETLRETIEEGRGEKLPRQSYPARML